MSKFHFLSYLPDPFGVLPSLFCVQTADGEVLQPTAAQVSGYGAPLITYDVPALVDDLRRLDLPPPATIADLGQAIRLSVGQPKDEGGEKQWDVWQYIAAFFETETLAEQFTLITQSKRERLTGWEMLRLMERSANALRLAWEHLEKQLAQEQEIQRYLDVEVPIQSIFAFRQSKGLALDREKLEQLLSVVADEKYRAYHRVASTLNISPTGLNFWNITPYLDRTDANHLAGQKNGGRLREAFKLASESSAFAADFLQYVDAARDETTLRRANGLEDRLHPIFDTLGTVSGRILVSDPLVQQLRRSYRSIIAADPGKQLAYLDYAQFEPGILAFLCQDQKLIGAYNQDDLYAALSEKVFGSREFRPIAKRIFLAFCYGMSTSGVVRLLDGPQPAEGQSEAHQGAINSFFDTFTELASFREKSALQLEKVGYVSSLLGNSRRRSRMGPLSKREHRWAMNQPVQSTAALIFKEATIDLANSFGRSSILIPMHDAVLMQFTNDANFDDCVSEAQKIMIKAFTRRCPGIQPRITVGPFSQ